MSDRLHPGDTAKPCSDPLFLASRDADETGIATQPQLGVARGVLYAAPFSALLWMGIWWLLR